MSLALQVPVRFLRFVTTKKLFRHHAFERKFAPGRLGLAIHPTARLYHPFDVAWTEMISLYLISLLCISLLISLPIMFVVVRSLLITSSVTIDPDFNSWTCNRCWQRIEGFDTPTLTKNVCSHLRNEHTILGRIVGH
jgi:hypothetical protein